MNSKNKKEDLNVVWKPQKGSQQLYLSCPIYEVLYDGTRGSQKTDSIIMDFAQDVGRGYGRAWRGLIFRRTYKQLDDIVERTKKWFYMIFPGAKYNESKYVWTFPSNEQLLLRHMDNPDDYWNYHGHEYSSYHKSLVEYSSGQKVEARHVKVGDMLQTLSGPRRVNKVSHYEKYPVELSLFDSHSNLIGRQLQGVLHPVLTTSGWQRLGLSCLSQISSQSSSWEPLTKEVEKFLLGIYQEIGLSFSRMLQNPLDDSISRLNRVQFSSLHQILSQLRGKVCHPYAFARPHPYIDQGTQTVSSSRKNLGIFSLEYLRNTQNVQQLVSLSAFLASLVLKIHSIHAHLIRSMLFGSFGKYSSLSIRKYQFVQQCRYEKQNNSLQLFLLSRLMQDQIAWNDTFAYVHSLTQGAQGLRANYLNEYDLDDGLPLQVLGTDQFSFPLRDDVRKYNDHPMQTDVRNKKQLNNLSCKNLDVYTHPYSHESSQTVVPLKPYNFRVRALPGPPVKMCDFEIDEANHYITHVADTSQPINENNSIQIINSNSFIAWEELTGWPDDKCYDAMKSCCRSSHPDVPRKYRASTNPWGIGMNWVKQYFVDPAPAGTIITNEVGEQRVRIHGSILENKVLLKADPAYIKKLDSIKDPNKRKAWRDGSWNITAGGALDDVWDDIRHVIEPFEIPHSWRIDRTFDWGSARPFSVGWWAESDGTDALLVNGKTRSFPRGTIFRIYEFYGWNGTENEGCRMLASDIAKEINVIEDSIEFRKIAGNSFVQKGPADTSIFDVENNMCIAADMRREGISWEKANKSPGSRRQGLEKLRRFLSNSSKIPMEKPGLLIFSNCRHFIRTVPTLPRDKRNIEDVESSAEDHCFHGDTEIITDAGPYEIKNLIGKTGWVLSAGGYYSRFSNCRKTRESRQNKIIFDDNSDIVCTVDQKYLTNSGWIFSQSLLDLSDEGRYSVLSFKNKGEYLCESRLSMILHRSLMEEIITFAEITTKKMENDYTELFGNIIMEGYRRHMKSTTENMILLLIKLKTLNYCLQKNIDRCMQSEMIMLIGWLLCILRQTSGMVAKREKNGIKNNMQNIVRVKSINGVQEFVNVAAENIMERLFRNFVRIIANQETEGNPESIWSKKFAFGVENSLSPRNIITSLLVQEAAGKNTVYQKKVLRIENVSAGPAYCMDVEDSKCFVLSNGVAVSNCYDETRYRLLLKRYKDREQKKYR